jgi:hypothetical protein
MSLTQTSKAALASKGRADFVVTSTRTANARVSVALDQLYAGVLREGEVPPPWDLVQEAQARILDQSTAEVVGTDDRHRRNLVEASQLRRQRQQLIRSLERRIRDLRKSFDGHHGEASLELVGLEDPPAETQAALTKQVQDVLLRLRDPVLELPPPQPGVTALDPGQIADAIEADVGALTEVMAALTTARKRSDESLVAKREALALHRDRYLNVARIQEAFYRLVGLHDLADRIRPLGRPWRRPPEPAEEPPPAPPPP